MHAEAQTTTHKKHSMKMARNCIVIFILVLSLVRLCISVRDIPSENPVLSHSDAVDVPNSEGDTQTFVHANAPVEAASPGASTGLKDKKNFIYGGVGGFAGMGGYAGVVGGLPVLGGLGGIGKYGGIGGAAGLGGGVGGLPGGLPGVGVPGTGAVGTGGLPFHP